MRVIKNKNMRAELTRKRVETTLFGGKSPKKPGGKSRS
jgi:hypothetical protein